MCLMSQQLQQAYFLGYLKQLRFPIGDCNLFWDSSQKLDFYQTIHMVSRVEYKLFDHSNLHRPHQWSLYSLLGIYSPLYLLSGTQILVQGTTGCFLWFIQTISQRRNLNLYLHGNQLLCIVLMGVHKEQMQSHLQINLHLWKIHFRNQWQLHQEYSHFQRRSIFLPSKLQLSDSHSYEPILNTQVSK